MVISIGLIMWTNLALAAPLPFNSFLKNFQMRSPTVLQANQRLSEAERSREQNTDQWQSRLEATQDLSFLNRDNESPATDVVNRSSSISGVYSQQMPSGTSLEVRGQKFLEIQNPLFSARDRSYSARISQDLIRNSFGSTQRAQMNQANTDLDIARLRYRRSVVDSCGEAFELFTDTFIQQEIADLYQTQLTDARSALTITRRQFKNRLINEIDKLASESDYIRLRLETEQAQQRFINNKRLILAYMTQKLPLEFRLQSPASFGNLGKVDLSKKTLNEVVANKNVESQEFQVTQARTDRYTDLQLGLEVGQEEGRLAFGPTPTRYREDYLKATLTVGFDLLNKTEDSALKNAINIKNQLAVQNVTTEQNQRSLLQNLNANDLLLRQQLGNAEKQVTMLARKSKLAFQQMKRAKLDFQQYLLHRNAYLQQQRNYLNLQKDLWLNRFALQKEFAHTRPKFCEVN